MVEVFECIRYFPQLVSEDNNNEDNNNNNNQRHDLPSDLLLKIPMSRMFLSLDIGLVVIFFQIFKMVSSCLV